jgi:hypothetical protein
MTYQNELFNVPWLIGSENREFYWVIGSHWYRATAGFLVPENTPLLRHTHLLVYARSALEEKLGMAFYLWITGHGASMFVARIPIKMWEFDFETNVVFCWSFCYWRFMSLVEHGSYMFVHSQQRVLNAESWEFVATLEKWCSLAQLEKLFRSLR